VVGVSWNNFQQERWAAHDEPNLKATVEAGGGRYIRADANLSNEQQLVDVDTLISQGATVLVLLSQDASAVLPAVAKAKEAGIPIISYDRLTEDPDVLYITFDNVDVGKAEAAALLEKVPTGNYVIIKGHPGDANASTFLPEGYKQAGLVDKINSKEITILNSTGGTNWPDDYGTFTDQWKTENAQANMETIIDKAVADGTPIDAILAENDSTALGVVNALTAKSYGFPPLSGQDGEKANLNNVALHKQYVDVWKNSNELGKAAGAAALQLCAGTPIADVSLEGVVNADVMPLAGPKPADFTTPGGNVEKSLVLQVLPLTIDTLNKPIDAGFLTADQICNGVDPVEVPVCAGASASGEPSGSTAP
jgi:D-xylose transport system substrate-binding protein